ncbi:YciI family protein [Kribbella jiaozuonensis]|uniref:YciI family protein n=1 Tax=Kribbella jiaozuonensis TaxID=2575441 RepID=A0A4V5UX07_9ACTN|nr:YciI family protein [Kribbella jiaozuonensis]TKK77783.1 YciI family protein [Kribbella jiaozuonensis]
MRYMMIFKASEESEAGGLPSEESLTAMGLVMAEMAEKGVLLAGDGLLPSSMGFRLGFDDEKQRRVIDGPFAETKELIAGFCLIEVASRQEAIEWGWRCVAADGRTDGELEIRPVPTAEFFGDNYTSEARDRNEETFQKAAENLQNSNT